MQFFEFLKNASMAGLIQWKPTGEEFESELFGTQKGYETTFDGYHIKTVVLGRQSGFWGGGDCAHGIIIEKDGEVLTLTDDPKAIPGQKVEGLDIKNTFWEIQMWAENRDMATSLTRSLARLFYA